MTRFFAALLLIAASCGPAAARPAPSGDPPNVVLIISDDQGWGDYSFMGHPRIRTPHLDKLARQSLLFRRGYIPSSLCRPSLSTILTGLYPHQHGITSNDPPRGLPKAEFLAQRRRMIDRIDRVPTLPRLLAKKGYVSFQAGKWWEGNHARGGFTAGMTHGDPKRGGRHGDAGLAIGRKGLKPVFDFIESAGEKPFFLWYAPFLPHTPHTPPERLFKKHVGTTESRFVARYRAMCEWFDETCGELLGYLDRKGLAGNTLVLYVCDNGWIQRPDARGYAPRSKRSPYDGGIRTPIMVRWPGQVEPADSDRLAISTDLAPTVLAACGLESTAEMQGVNLLDAGAVGSRDRITGEIFLHNAKDITHPASSLKYRWVIEGKWKLIVPDGANVTGEPMLFDLLADPHEREDLAQRQPGRVRALTRTLDAWWAGR